LRIAERQSKKPLTIRDRPPMTEVPHRAHDGLACRSKIVDEGGGSGVEKKKKLQSARPAAVKVWRPQAGFKPQDGRFCWVVQATDGGGRRRVSWFVANARPRAMAFAGHCRPKLPGSLIHKAFEAPADGVGCERWRALGLGRLGTYRFDRYKKKERQEPGRGWQVRRWSIAAGG